MADKIDKLLDTLSTEDIDTLFARILHKRADKISQPSAKRFRSGSGQDNMIDEGNENENEWNMVRGKKSRKDRIREQNENPFQNIPGFPVTIQNIPPDLIKKIQLPSAK